jgi:hypothetical protein
MGGSSSKPALPSFQALDPTRGTYSGEYVSQLQATNQAATQAAYKVAQSAYTTASTWKTVAYSIAGIVVATIVGIIIYDIVARANGWRTILLPGVSHFSNREGMDNQKCYGDPVDISSKQFLDLELLQIMFLGKARDSKCNMNDIACAAKALNVHQTLEDAKTDCNSSGTCLGIVHWNGGALMASATPNSLIPLQPLAGYYAFKSEPSGGAIVPISPKVLPTDLTLLSGVLTYSPQITCPATPVTPVAPATPATPAGDTTVHTTGSPYSSTPTDPYSVSIPGPTGPTGATGSGAGAGGTTGTPPPPPLLWEWWYGAGSLAGAVDGTGTTVVPATYAPLSAGNQGAYGMQWWMYIKDWNYGYGKEKPIIVRPDTTNSAIMNPRVVLHPTDNSLRISVSVFPSGEDGSVSEPAPAGHAGSTDDVFVCEVPNIPLQSWFSVSLTVFERNLDVYLNGMLVKSCFMSGVPKPAVGDIQVTPEGGFSGMVCGLTSSNKMLNPSDALAFYSSDNSCHTISDKPSAAVNTTGYSVKFGVYDTVGRQVREYTF